MSNLRIKLGMSDTLQAEELRHVSVKSLTDDYMYYVMLGTYKPESERKMKEPSEAFRKKIKALRISTAVK